MRSALVLVSVAAACSSPDPIAARQLPEAVRADAAAIAESNNQFACDAFAKLPTGNVFFSPFSISTALAMVTAVPEALEADRPFVFFIFDHVTGSILFMGRLVDPTH